MTNIFEEAFNAYKMVCDNGTPVTDNKGNVYNMLSFQYPSESLSVVGRKYVYLRNCNGAIARYVIKTGEIII